MMVNFQRIVLILVTLYTQCVLGVYNQDLKLNWNSADFGNYFNVAGKKIPIETNDKFVENVLDMSRSFLRDGIIGSLLRDFEGIQKDTGNLYYQKHSDEIREANVFSAEKQTGGPYEVSFTCLNDTKQVMLDILAKKPYAIGMLDADTKIPSGIMQGHWLWLGSYDECKSVQSPSLPSGHQITGQYCLTSTLKYLPVMGYKPLSFGTCVPNSCSEDDVKALLRSLIDNGSGPPKPVLAVCDKEKSYSNGDITSLVVCGILGLLVCIGTLIDIYLRYTDDVGHKQDANRQMNGRVIQTNERTGLLSSTSVSLEENPLIHPASNRVKRWPMLTSIMTSFSFVKNTEKLLSTSTASSPLSSLNGMRVLSMWWVILGHTFELPISYQVVQNPLQAAKIGKRFTFQAILNGTFSVDTFFFM
ncbi:O-acyltransferase like protein-like, partial [Mizuhopecten yessoensis]|uniref:O-acyltransferase like protein-like n=1 Tax=Mizuhopecten yessoensis TaxID=6573 RepID=UPI000B45E224